MSIKSVLIYQPEPTNGNSHYSKINRKYKRKINYRHFIHLKGFDLSNFEWCSNVFRWFETCIKEVNNEVCNNILLKLDEINTTKNKDLDLKKKSVISEIDKDGNGLVDVIEGLDEIDVIKKT